MIILALDAASETGACDGAVGGKPRLWTWFLRDAGDSRPQRLLMLHRFLVAYFAKEPCDAVVYEAPIPHGAKVAMSDDVVGFLRGSIAIIEMTCAMHGKPVESLSPQDARESVLGWRTNRKPVVIMETNKRTGIAKAREQTTKERVLVDVRMLGISPENDNEADAAVLWTYACNLQSPRLAIACTPLFREH